MPKKQNTDKTKSKQKTLNRLKLLPSIALLLVAGFLSLSAAMPGKDVRPGVLAYATNTTRSGLLSATNSQRTNNGAAALSLNSKLNSAAQSKANDMVSRDYWSHATPDGKQPWIFFTAAGYDYLAAGENLAYGYPDSNSTVVGWMNSPPHKSNLISSNYTEVGFGIANSPDFVNNGPQTVVVAMYGKPQVASATTTAPTTPVPKPKPADQPVAKEAVPKKELEAAPKAEPEPEKEPIAVQSEENEDEEVQIAAAPASTSRIQLLTNGSAVWSATALIMLVCSTGLLWAIHKGVRVHRYVVAGEHFLARHVYLDVFVVSLVILGFVLLSTSGSIR